MTLLAVTVHRPLTGVQRWFLAAAEADGEECYVVAPDALQLLPLVLADETSDEAARAEVELERAAALLVGGEPVAEWVGPNAHGQRVRQSSRR